VSDGQIRRPTAGAEIEMMDKDMERDNEREKDRALQAEEMKPLQDAYGRRIDYLRISLTDRCNLRCGYCMPRDGILPLKHEEILRLEEVYRVAEVLTGMGIRRIRLTGGEPLVRRNLLMLVRKLGELPEKPELAMTTNGVLLGDSLDELYAVGLRSVNISLDTRDPATYRTLTGVDALDRVEQALERALALGMKVKLNSVLIRDVNDGELESLAGMAKDHPMAVRFIELMPIGCARGYTGVDGSEILNRLEKAYGPAEPVMGYEIGRGPAEYVHFQGFQGNVGFINPMSHAFCATCNRVRLTADGRLKLCLYYPNGPELLPMIRRGCSDEELREVILRELQYKPERHDFGTKDKGKCKETRNMNQIGG